MATPEELGYALSELLDEIEALAAEALPGDPILLVMTAGMEEQRAVIEEGCATEALIKHWREVRDRLEEYLQVDEGLTCLRAALVARK